MQHVGLTNDLLHIHLLNKHIGGYITWLHSMWRSLFGLLRERPDQPRAAKVRVHDRGLEFVAGICALKTCFDLRRLVLIRERTKIGGKGRENSTARGVTDA